MRFRVAFAALAVFVSVPAFAKDPPKKKAAAGATAPVDPDDARASVARPAPGKPLPTPKPAPTAKPAPVPVPEGAIAVDLGACVRNYGCALKGNAPGKYKSTVTQKKSAYKMGEAIDVTYGAMPGTSSNWITLVPAGQEDNSWCSWQWATGTTGTQQYGGLPKGSYEVRLYYAWSDGQCEVIGRKKFSVQ